MRTFVLTAVTVLVSAFGAAAGAPDNPFLGRWDITATTGKETYPLWLEVRGEGGQLVGWVVADGVLTNEQPGNNIISTAPFKDFSKVWVRRVVVKPIK